MKRFLGVVAILLSLIARGQSIEEQLKAQVLKLEADQFKQGNQPVGSLQFASYQYSLIPIKAWWKRLYDVHTDFRTQMDLLTSETYERLQRQDKQKGTHEADSLAASIRREEQKNVAKMSNEEVHFKALYESADPSQKVYEVLYQVRYKQNGQDITTRPVRHAFYQHNLTQVRSSN